MTPTEIHIDALHDKIDSLEKEIKKLRVDLSEAEKCIPDSQRLLFLIENQLTVVVGINSFWVAKPDGLVRVGYKCVTPREAIDEYQKLCGK